MRAPLARTPRPLGDLSSEWPRAAAAACRYFRYKPFYNKARPEHASELALDVVEALSLRPGAPAVRAVKLPESPAERALIRRGVSFPLWWNGAQPQWLP
jgi:hypothetical protein